MRFFKKFREKSKFDKDFEDLIASSSNDNKEISLNSKIREILKEFPEFEDLKLMSFEEVDCKFNFLISSLSDLYEEYREKLGSEIMKSSSLVELNQLIFGLRKNKELLYREEFDLKEFLRFEFILIGSLKKLK